MSDDANFPFNEEGKALIKEKLNRFQDKHPIFLPTPEPPLSKLELFAMHATVGPADGFNDPFSYWSKVLGVPDPGIDATPLQNMEFFNAVEAKRKVLKAQALIDALQEHKLKSTTHNTMIYSENFTNDVWRSTQDPIKLYNERYHSRRDRFFRMIDDDNLVKELVKSGFYEPYINRNSPEEVIDIVLQTRKGGNPFTKTNPKEQDFDGYTEEEHKAMLSTTYKEATERFFETDDSDERIIECIRGGVYEPYIDSNAKDEDIQSLLLQRVNYRENPTGY